MKFETVNINLALTPEVVQVLQIAVGHLAMSIDNGSFEVGNKQAEEAMMDNLHGLHNQMDNILQNFQ